MREKRFLDQMEVYDLEFIQGHIMTIRTVFHCCKVQQQTGRPCQKLAGLTWLAFTRQRPSSLLERPGVEVLIQSSGSQEGRCGVSVLRVAHGGTGGHG